MVIILELSHPLKANDYTKTFFRDCQKPVTTSNALDEREPATGFAVIPYIQGVTEPIKRILNSHNVKVAQKPFQTLGHIFAKPKDPVTKEQRLKEHQKAVIFFQKGQFCFIGAHMSNQP